jgi:hypothetical protein
MNNEISIGEVIQALVAFTLAYCCVGFIIDLMKGKK